MRACGRRWVQTLVGAVSASPPENRGIAEGPMTRVAFELDAGFSRSGAALPSDTSEPWADGGPDAVRGSFAVTDLRAVG